MPTDKEIIDLVDCSFCLVGLGEPCKDTRTGKLTRRPHPSRQERAGWMWVGEHPGPDSWGEDYLIVHD